MVEEDNRVPYSVHSTMSETTPTRSENQLPLVERNADHFYSRIYTLKRILSQLIKPAPQQKPSTFKDRFPNLLDPTFISTHLRTQLPPPQSPQAGTTCIIDPIPPHTQYIQQKHQSIILQAPALLCNIGSCSSPRRPMIPTPILQASSTPILISTA